MALQRVVTAAMKSGGASAGTFGELIIVMPAVISESEN